LFLIGRFNKIFFSETTWQVDSFGQAVTEERNFLEINQSETRIVCGGHVL
jgi:hypothetical protein